MFCSPSLPDGRRRRGDLPLLLGVDSRLRPVGRGVGHHGFHGVPSRWRGSFVAPVADSTNGILRYTGTSSGRRHSMSGAIQAIFSMPIGGRRLPLPNATLAMRMAAFVLLWLFIFLIPADEQLAPLPYWIGILSGIVGFGAVLLSGKMRRPSPAHYPLLALLLWAAASYLWSAAPESTIVRLQTYAQLLILVWLIWEFAPDRERQSSLMRAYVLGTLLPALDTLYNFAQNNQARTETLGMSSVVRYTAGGYNENDLGLLLALSLPFSCYLALSTQKPLLQISYCLQICLALAAIVLTASRMAFVVAVLALVLAPLLLPHIASSRRIYIFGGLLSIAVLAAVIIPQDSWQRLS